MSADFQLATVLSYCNLYATLIFLQIDHDALDFEIHPILEDKCVLPHGFLKLRSLAGVAEMRARLCIGIVKI